ncbi:Periplasmic (Fe) hydrogenase [Exiguobacterium sp. 8H]|uniref:hypothetical protein n=1 Tax=unclassified Exiguobacterium TaxID=2644629 RepID=UPI0012EFD25A|nr:MULTISPECIES: hypothetical protein [unclassified Exiguobacterium]VXB50925.1 hypothetical protein EXIGUO8A_11391 [Exiguobacterium sp. 8A]VXB52028.1 Periplasmic (Fe) hydrogenase [Exiguobacterium sp. 8H]
MDWFIKGLGCLVWGCKKTSRSMDTEVPQDQETLREQLVASLIAQAESEGDKHPEKAWDAFSKDIRNRLKQAG